MVKNTIVYFSEKHQNVKRCTQDSEKAKELHTCPFKEDVNGDSLSLCDCGKKQQKQCREDI